MKHQATKKATTIGKALAHYASTKATTTPTDHAPTASETPDLFALRNKSIGTAEKTARDLDLIDNIAVRSVWSTLNFLVANGATTQKATEDINAPKGERPQYGYNVALALLQDLPHDLSTLRTGNTSEAYGNAIDLVQEVRHALTPFVCSDIELTAETVIYTKQLKNGATKDYTLFKYACNAIRRYIQAQGQKEYKKQAYIIGFTDDGKQVTTTKRPKDDLADITEEKRRTFLTAYGLTAQEQEILLHYINGKKPAEIAPLVNMTFEATKKALYRAKQAIKAQNTALK